MNTAVTARLRPTSLPHPFTVIAALAAVLVIGVLAVATLHRGDPNPRVSSRVDPLDQNSPEARMHNAAGYVRRWESKVGPDGTAHVRREELRSCYNLLTQGELPRPAGDPRPAGE